MLTEMLIELVIDGRRSHTSVDWDVDSVSLEDIDQHLTADALST